MKFSFDDKLLRNNQIRPEDKLILAVLSSVSINSRVNISNVFRDKVIGVSKVSFLNSLNRLRDLRILDYQEKDSILLIKLLNETESLNLPVNETKKKKTDPTLKYSEQITEIVNYLNQVVGSHIRDTGAGTRSKITALLNENYSVDDFKKVVDNMSSRWKGNPKMEGYLVPSTLFSKKHFDDYLNKGKIMNIHQKMVQEREQKTKQRNGIHGW